MIVNVGLLVNKQTLSVIGNIGANNQSITPYRNTPDGINAIATDIQWLSSCLSNNKIDRKGLQKKEVNEFKTIHNV